MVVITNISDFLAYIQQGLDSLGLTPIIQGFLIIIGAIAVVGWILNHRS